jgi:hypothetical protein
MGKDIDNSYICKNYIKSIRFGMTWVGTTSATFCQAGFARHAGQTKKNGSYDYEPFLSRTMSAICVDGIYLQDGNEIKLLLLEIFKPLPI